MKTALITGATGLTGSTLLKTLLDSDYYNKVSILTRRSMGISHPKLEERIVDFDKLQVANCQADDIYCCLGTTIKKAGSQQAQYKIDAEYPFRIAQLGLEAGASQYLIITALGASAESSVFYNRMKGEVENKLKTLPYRSLHILRPSVILGNRQEFRLGEKIAVGFIKVLGIVMVGPLLKYAGIHADKIAKALFAKAKEETAGQYVWESDTLHQY